MRGTEARNSAVGWHWKQTNKRFQWADENPRSALVHGHQRRFTVNITGSTCLGLTCCLLDSANIENVLASSPPEIIGGMRRRLWYQHDGAPSHFASPVCAVLANTFGNRWIGRGACKLACYIPGSHPIRFLSLRLHEKSSVFLPC